MGICINGKIIHQNGGLSIAYACRFASTGNYDWWTDSCSPRLEQQLNKYKHRSCTLW